MEIIARWSIDRPLRIQINQIDLINKKKSLSRLRNRLIDFISTRTARSWVSHLSPPIRIELSILLESRNQFENFEKRLFARDSNAGPTVDRRG